MHSVSANNNNNNFVAIVSWLRHGDFYQHDKIVEWAEVNGAQQIDLCDI